MRVEEEFIDPAQMEAMFIDISLGKPTFAPRQSWRPEYPIVVEIPSGEFLMGASSNDREASPSENPPHRVIFSHSMSVWSTPVTWAQYIYIVGTLKESYSIHSHPGELSLESPVDTVNWFDAVAFCNALSRRCGLPESYIVKDSSVQWLGLRHPGWRLPSEAEWEFLCRAGSGLPRYGGLLDISWNILNSGIRTQPVGLKLPNAWGLFDTLGNVREWCWDWFGDYKEVESRDPTGPDSGKQRCLRGGCGLYPGKLVRASSRDADLPLRNGSVSRAATGIRPVRTIL